MTGKLIIFSAPSGSGKTTIVRHILEQFPDLEFSVSACSRPKRAGEVHGRDYYFLGREEFLEKIRQGEFVEWEEVYPGSYYGTLKSELKRIWDSGKHVVFDIDVAGGLNLKNQFGSRALAIFIRPPSLADLEKRLRGRSSESEEKLEERLKKAGSELACADRFDRIILNDKLNKAVDRAGRAIEIFLHPRQPSGGQPPAADK